jgi:hypothetical protein
MKLHITDTLVLYGDQYLNTFFCLENPFKLLQMDLCFRVVRCALFRFYITFILSSFVREKNRNFSFWAAALFVRFCVYVFFGWSLETTQYSSLIFNCKMYIREAKCVTFNLIKLVLMKWATKFPRHWAITSLLFFITFPFNYPILHSHYLLWPLNQISSQCVIHIRQGSYKELF